MTQIQFRRCVTVKEALAVLRDMIQLQRGGDEHYFKEQVSRYILTINRITQLCPSPCRILDIGSHYLHQAVLLSLLGYEVYGIDVPLFTESKFIRNRSEMMNIRNIRCDTLETGNFLNCDSRYFDIVLFTETLEHLTFNPVRLWQRVYELLSDKGIIYLTTPNSLRAGSFLRTLLRLMTFNGVGLSIKDILGGITYGHHWKEYSAREIKEYFRALSPDFKVEIRWFSYSAESRIRSAASLCFDIIPILRSNIEAVIRLDGKTRFIAMHPTLPMMRSSEDKNRCTSQI